MRTYRSALVVVLALVAALGAAYGARLLTDRPAPVPAVLRPSGLELPLAKDVTYAGSGTRDGFTMRAPAIAKVAKTSTDRAPMLVTVKVGKKPLGIVVGVMDNKPLDPVAVLTKELETISARGYEVSDVVYRTRFAGGEAAVADSTMAKTTFREVYFVHEGALWEIRIIAPQGDQASLDTGLAMLATWEWD